MKSKHTPGPWQVAFENPLEVCDASDELGCGPIAYCDSRKGSRANARLIAAAPELLAALKQIARLAHDGQVCAQVQHALGDIARAALAKAEG